MLYKILGKIIFHNLPLFQRACVISTGNFFHPPTTIYSGLSSVLCCLSTSSLVVVGMMCRMAGGAEMCTSKNVAELGRMGQRPL